MVVGQRAHVLFRSSSNISSWNTYPRIYISYQEIQNTSYVFKGAKEHPGHIYAFDASNTLKMNHLVKLSCRLSLDYYSKHGIGVSTMSSL